MAIAAVVAGNRIVISDLNAFYNLLKGVTGSGENITLVYNAESLTFQPSADPAAGTIVWNIKNNAGTTLASMRFDGLLKLLAAAADPATPVTGSLYFDTLTSSLKFYDGNAWQYVNGLGSPDQVGKWDVDWNGRIGGEATVTGTGSVSYPSLTAVAMYAFLATGATTGGTAGHRLQFHHGSVTGSMGGVGKCRLLQITAEWSQIDANTSGAIYLTDENATTAPSATARHLGVKWAGTTFSFSTADGTTEQTTNISASISATLTAYFIDITFDGTTAKCYVNGTLVGTHTTNVPATQATTVPIMRGYIVNAANADKTVGIARFHSVFSAV